jgi:hypothetical protein
LTIHFILSEPGTRDIYNSSTGGETAVWFKLGDYWDSVEVEFEIRGVIVGALNVAVDLLSVSSAVSVMIGNTDVDILTNEHGHNTALTSNIWWVEIEMLCNVWSDGTNIFLNLLFIINVWIVGLGDLKKFI